MKAVFSLLKKDMRLYMSRILSIILLLALLTLGTALAFRATVQSATPTGQTRFTVALYDKEPSSVANTAIGFISEMDTIKSLFSIEICDSEEDVLSGMKNGAYDAAIVFEEGYFEKILNGGDQAVRILMSDKFTAASDIVGHFALTGEKLIKIAEAGIEATLKDLESDSRVENPYKVTNQVEIDYALELFSLPSSSFSVEEIPYSACGLSIDKYYFACFSVFLLLLCEVIFFTYTASDCSYSMLRRIKSYRISNASIVIEKAILPFVIRFVIVIIIMLFASKTLSTNLAADAFVYALFAVALVSLFSSALSVLLSQTSLGISIIFAISALGLILCGGLIPSIMLPKAVTQIGSFTPSGLALKVIAPAFGGYTSASAIAILAAVTALLVLLACLYMHRICKKGGGER